jgi:hypothetical protein
MGMEVPHVRRIKSPVLETVPGRGTITSIVVSWATGVHNDV